MVIKTAAGHWEKGAGGSWHFIENKQAVAKKKAKTARINIDSDEDCFSDPDLLKESGGHVDQDGNFIEDF